MKEGYGNGLLGRREYYQPDGAGAAEKALITVGQNVIRDIRKEFPELPNFSALLDYPVRTDRFDSVENLQPELREYFSRIITFYPEEFAHWKEILDEQTYDKVVGILVGGKGKNTRELQEGQYNVPDYSCLTSNVYFNMVEAHRPILEEYIVPAGEGEYTGWSYTEENLERLSERAVQIFSNYQFPKVVIDEIDKMDDQIRAKGFQETVARSSNTVVEDALTTSGAGRNDSYLYLKTREQVRKAHKDVMISQWCVDSLRYSFDNGTNPMDGGICSMAQGFIRATHCAVGFSYETGEDEARFNLAYGIGETLAQGISGAAEVLVKRGFNYNDIQTGTWITNDSEHILVNSRNQTVLIVTISHQDEAYVTNPDSSGVEDTTIIQSVNKKLPLNFIKAALPELVRQQRVATEEYGHGQDCEFPLISKVQDETAESIDPSLIDVYIAQKRTNTSDTEKVSAQDLPPKPLVNKEKIFKAPNHLTNSVFSGRLVILDTKKVLINKRGDILEINDTNLELVKSQLGEGWKQKEIVVDEFGNKFEPIADDADVIYVCKNGTAAFDGILFNQKPTPKALYIKANATSHSCLLIAGEKDGHGAILNIPRPESVLEAVERIGLRSGQVVTIDEQGNIFDGLIPELVEWQDQVDAITLANLILEVETNPKLRELTQISFNVSTLEGAQKMYDKIGKFINPLTRSEKLVSHLTKTEEHPDGIDLHYIAKPEVVATPEGAEYYEQFVEKMAQELAGIARLTKETTYRFGGPAGLERNGFGAPAEALENPTKLGFYQGARDNLIDRSAFELECNVIKRTVELLGDEAHKLMIMPQYVRTAEEFYEWRKAAVSDYGINPEVTKIGAMMEVPGLGMPREMEALAKYGCKFISDGTGDLESLLPAADKRMGSEATASVDKAYPGDGRQVMNFIETTAYKATELGMRVKICGTILANNPNILPYLSEWGIDYAPVNTVRTAKKVIEQAKLHLENDRKLPKGYILHV